MPQILFEKSGLPVPVLEVLAQALVPLLRGGPGAVPEVPGAAFAAQDLARQEKSEVQISDATR